MTLEEATVKFNDSLTEYNNQQVTDRITGKFSFVDNIKLIIIIKDVNSEINEYDLLFKVVFESIANLYLYKDFMQKYKKSFA
jgi:hypothetical protein